MVFTESHVTDLRVTAYGAAFGLDQDPEHRFDIGRVSRQRSRRTGRYIVEIHHAFRQLASQLIDARHQGFEMITVLDSRVLGDFLESFSFKPDQINPQYGVV